MTEHKVINISGSQGWQPSGISVQNGKRLTILPLRHAGEQISVRAFEEPDEHGAYVGTDTGITLAPGESVIISEMPGGCGWCWAQEYMPSITSRTSLTLNDSGGFCCDADGDSAVTGNENFRVPGAPAGALVGRIGASGEWFLVGKGPRIITAGESEEGSLYLGINDQSINTISDSLQNSGFSDNTGRLHVQIIRPSTAGPGLISSTDLPDTLRARVNGGAEFMLPDGFDQVFTGTGGTLELATNGSFYDQLPVVVMVDAPAAPIHNGLWPFAHDAEPVRDGLINLRTFDRVLSETDLTVFTPAGPLTFTRFYNSSRRLDPEFRFMGLGWSHNHALSLTIDTSASPKTAQVIFPNGGVLKMEGATASHFDALAGSSSVLDLSGSSYVLTAEDESEFTFEPVSGGVYRLHQRSWPNGETWTYAYTDGKLTAVDDGHGRGLSLTYYGSENVDLEGLLMEVADHTGGTFSYAYVIPLNLSYPLLVSVTDGRDSENPAVWGYSYDEIAFILNSRKSPAVDQGGAGYKQIISLEEVNIPSEVMWRALSDDINALSKIVGTESLYITTVYPAFGGPFPAAHLAATAAGEGIQSAPFDMSVTKVYQGSAHLWNFTGNTRIRFVDSNGDEIPLLPGNWNSASGTDVSASFRCICKPQQDIAGARVQIVNLDDAPMYFDWIDGSVTEVPDTIFPDLTITQSRGDSLVSTAFEYQPDSLNLTRETVACAHTTHHFANGAYVGAANPRGELAPRVMLESYRPKAWADPLGHVTQLGWINDDKLLETITDPIGNATQFGYMGDIFDNSTDAENRYVVYSYGNASVPRLPTAVKVYKDSTSLVTPVQWRSFGYEEIPASSGIFKLVTEQEHNPATGAAIRITTRSYYTAGDTGYGDGLLKTVTVQNLLSTGDLTTTYFYDALGRVVQVNRAPAFGSCEKTRTVYDAAGRAVAEICNYDPPDPNNPPQDAAEAAALYDGNQPDKNRVTTYSYDEIGRRVQTRSYTTGLTTLTAYDTLNRVIRTIQNYVMSAMVTEPYVASRDSFDRTDGKNLITDFIYNERGLLRKQIDDRDAVTLYGYDDAGRPIRTIANASQPDYGIYSGGDDPELKYYRPGPDTAQDQISQTFYDAAGNVIETVDASGSRTLYVYNENGKMVKTIVNAKPEATVKIDPSDAAYDAANDPRSSSYQAAPAAGSDLTTTQTYDGVGNVVKSVNPAGSVTMNVYDAVNRVTRTLRNPKDTATLDLKPGDVGYNAADDPRSDSYTASLAADRDLITETVYDGASRVQKTHSVAGTWSLTGYDGLGRTVRTIQSASNPTYDISSDVSLSGYTPSGQPDQDFVSLTAYNDDGQVRYTTDPLGRKTWMVYDTLGRVVRTIQNCTFVSGSPAPEDETYVGSGQPDEDLITRTIYDAAGRVSATIDTRGNQARTEYDSLGRQVRTIVNFVNGVYDPAHPDQDMVSTTVYDQKGQVASTIDPAGIGTRYEYDSAGRRIRTIANYQDGIFDPARPDEDVISLTEYDRAGRVVASVDARGTRTTFNYDGAGRRISMTQAAGTELAATSYTCLDPAGRALRSIQNWVDNGMSPDARLAGGAFAFDPQTHGRFEDQNLVTSYTLDLAGRVTALMDPMGSQTYTAYDKDGLVTSMTDPLGFVTQQRYDAARRLTTVVQTHADNGEDPADWVWDGDDERYEKSDGTAVSHGVANDRNIIVMMDYDAASRLTSRRDPRGNVTSYAYDGLDRRVGLTDPLSHTWTTSYAERPAGVGQRVTLLDPNGFQTRRDFDRLGRMTGLQYLGEDVRLTPDVSFTYDRAGNRTRMSETVDWGTLRETRFDYDRLGRLGAVGFDTDGDGNVDQTVRYGYDAAGLRTKLTLPDGLTVSYTYDERGALVGLTDWDKQGTDFTYDGAGRMIAAERGSGLRSRYKYDAGGRLKKLRHSRGEKVLGHFAYEVDARGNRMQALEAVPHAGTGQTMITAADTIVYYHRGSWSTDGDFKASSDPTAALRIGFFGTRATLVVGTGPNGGIFDVKVNDKLWRDIDGYAAASGERQLVILLDGEGPHTLTLENRGERRPASTGTRLAFKSLATNRAVDLHTIQYGYDAISRLLSAQVFPGVNTAAAVRDRQYAYTYDPSGNRLSKSLAVNGGSANVTSYTYNAANQLTGEGLNTFGYDANGNLTSKNGQTTHTYDRANRLLSFDGASYAYNGDGQRIGQSVNDQVTSYLLDVQPGLYKVLASTVGEDTTRYLHGPLGMQSQQSPQGAWVSPVMDGLGSVRGVVNDGLSSLESRQYEPYGEPFGSTGAEQTPFGFTGEWTDENDLLYLRARYLDVALGRFFQMDPLEGNNQQSQSINAYAYALGNPIRYVDPTGEQGGEGILELVNSLGPLLTALLAFGGIFAEAGAAIAEVAAVAVTLPGLLAVAGGILVGAVGYFGWQYLTDPGFHYNLNQILEAPPEVTLEVLEKLLWQEISDIVPKPPQLPQLPPGAEDKAAQLIGMLLIFLGTFLGIAQSAKDNACDPIAFQYAWELKDEVEATITNADSIREHDYETRVARDHGSYGEFARRYPAPNSKYPTKTIDVDGIEPSICYFVDAKYSKKDSLYDYYDEHDQFPWGDKKMKGLISEFERYRFAMESWAGDRRAKPRGLWVKTNNPAYATVIYDQLLIAGWQVGSNALVQEVP